MYRIAETVKIDGHVLEFGVYHGASLRGLAGLFPDRMVHGFDSFKGLPSEWHIAPGVVYKPGHFSPKKKMLTMPDNVRLWKGWFEDTIPQWVAEFSGPAAFVYIDSDLYESARTVLSLLDSRIVTGTVLVFDELGNWVDGGRYANWQEGEWRALNEWMASRRRRVEPIARGPKYLGAVRVM